MSVNRRFALIGASALATAALTLPAVAESADEAAVGKAVEAFRVGMQKNDGPALERLSSANLSYGHSAGKLQNRAEMVADTASRKSTWNSIAFNNRSIHVVGNNAIVRFMLVGQTLGEGKTSDINIGVLMVWTREGGGWKLLARQAYKV